MIRMFNILLGKVFNKYCDSNMIGLCHECFAILKDNNVAYCNLCKKHVYKYRLIVKTIIKGIFYDK